MEEINMPTCQHASEVSAGDADIKQNKLVMVLENYMS